MTSSVHETVQRAFKWARYLSLVLKQCYFVYFGISLNTASNSHKYQMVFIITMPNLYLLWPQM